MRVLFIVQGEGRGHLTQAISLAQLLERAGHTVVGAWVNVADGRPVPAFFSEQFTAPITPVQGPLLIYNPRTNALDLLTTVRKAVRNLACFRQSLRQLDEAIRTEEPDIVVNFFELLGGLTYGLYRPRTPMVCVGHQCMALHPSFPFPARKWLDRWLFQGLVRLNAWGAYERLGLSFDELPDQPEQHLRVMPPLLRNELMACRSDTEKQATGNYVLAYTTQPGLQSEVFNAHAQRPDIAIRYFHPSSSTIEQRTATLQFHPIDGRSYLEAMKHCRAVLTTAGFESVCEALYFGKPVLMMPQPRHYEQACNALDGQRAGAGISDTGFNLDRLLTFAEQYDSDTGKRFRQWQAQSNYRFVAALQQVSNQARYVKPKRRWLVLDTYLRLL